MLYRCDKKGFFLTAQCVVSILKRIFLYVFIALGHNNDQGVWNMSGMQEICIENNIKGLGDGGYHSVFLKTPLCLPINANELQYNETQRSLRAIVEVLQGLVQFWSAADEAAQQEPVQPAECPVMTGPRVDCARVRGAWGCRGHARSGRAKPAVRAACR
eukprot:TRINITY_DN1992_c0_g1_i7.p1 TRINITY_DN1992_c0_g1~~TRINITY_DN1992_c0_g1_i7.p1  ORF type:complete len:159 (-),score=14.56 TRINITY_DN1992_c0_g1_i7:182-658(-)